MPNFLSKILSFGADKDLKAYQRIVEKINALEPTMQEMSDEELQAQTEKFKARYAEGESLDDLLPEAFATVREASVRTIGQRHFDVQLIGGIALHKGTIAEMKTGEGKTLVSTLAGYLNALSGEGVHIVTVNDYLAKRDSEWMGTIYKFLGISVGLLQNGMRLSLKKPAYEADITYGTNSEFGFDYLRDNMVTRPEMRVQRGHHYAIVDEVDSILIDEARTPLIISGAGTKSAGTYKDFAKAVRGLTPDVDFEMDEAKHTIATTEIGLEKVERALNIDDIYNDETGQLVNHLQQALKAEYMFHRDQQYVVIDGEVKIVDEFTGRIMEGRRYSEGLHQAIEAKENVQVREENQTLATITLQNYFLMYDKLSGMTGTAMTEDAEFREVYHVPVQVIPPNRPVKREDLDDLVYRTIGAKFEAVVRDVEERHQNGQPVLVGTVSIDNSERISRILSKRGIKHNVLNAKFHEREAQIIAQAGREGAVTIATNMAGRGTDILLGGNPDVMAEDILRNQGIEPAEATQEQKEAARKEAKEICATEREAVTAAGGLCVIGTERHESRRIDNQLRGRSGRQGDPGQTQFYLSLEDDLMRRFGGDRMDGVAAMMQRYELPDDMPIKAKIVTKLVEGAQRKVEEVNFAMRKNVLDYDDVMNKQRQVIYAERNKILDGKDLMELIETVTASTTQRICEEFCYGDADEWDLEGLEKWLTELTGKTDLPEFTEDTKFDQLEEDVTAFVQKTFDEKTQKLGEEVMRELAAQVMLRVIDTRWMAYLQEMDYLKTGIGLRGFGQRDPLVEYKTEAYEAFTLLVNTMYEDFLRTILRLELVNRPRQNTEAEAFQNAHYSGGEETDGDQKALKQGKSMLKNAAAIGKSPQGTGASQSSVSTYRKSDDPNPYVNVGRNDPCPCGSGKKFKNCHGRNR
ncbi:preprotein translocase subunit SecA [Lancefieldella parvula DNF00906]|uniref:preprotein translocase subunit SecA n=1 Tax=Lancefieldella parvula TaxID=1382 RepID=UPI0005106095|nr:preprotein translocase subunit SecA [Lancefieldella parvula]KGF14224.1 preprotein translocase subunit SecA [Lancefieldella parvula DNF00906]